MPPMSTPSSTGSPQADSPAADRPDAGLPDDLRAWIDAHDPPLPGTPSGDAEASGPTRGDGDHGRTADEIDEDDEVDDAGERLAEQRAEHEPDRTASSGINEVLGDLVNNTGDDGGAASG